MNKKNENPNNINLVTALIQLHRKTTGILEKVAKSVTENDTKPFEPCSDELLKDFENMVKDATNNLFNYKPGASAVRDILKELIKP